MQAAAAYFCGRTYQDLLSDSARAERWFRFAVSLEPDFLYAHAVLVQLLFRLARPAEALQVALAAEAAGVPRRRLFMDCRVLQYCEVPLLISKALYYNYAVAEMRPAVMSSAVWQRRAELLRRSDQECREAAESSLATSVGKKLMDIRQLQTFWEAEGLAG